MNDFTKEELICIRDNIVVPSESPQKGIILNAYRKIVMMIDNYCDHDFISCIGKINVDICSKPKCLAIK